MRGSSAGARFVGVFALSCAVLLAHVCHGATPDEWAGRTIFQLLTDRYALPPSSSPSSSSSSLPDDLACVDQESYCGGSFSGIASQMDYFTGMGFDAFWLSPIPENVGHNYHGYAALNLNVVNPHFGGASELTALVTAAHAKGLYVMVDVVANHMGIAPTDQLQPFNQTSDYHTCEHCPQYCNIDDFNNATQVVVCRLDGLPDLDQSNPSVASTLNAWVQNFVVKQFAADGLRIDTVQEVNPAFWNGYVEAAGVYAVGEVFNGDVNLVSSYQSAPANMPGLLNYPLYFALINSFAKQQSMTQIQTVLQQENSLFRNVSLLGNFVENHDNPRFLSFTSDRTLFRNALGFILLAQGIPIVFQGAAQGYDGSSTPDVRYPLWPSNYNTKTELYSFIQQTVTFRKKMAVWTEPQVQRYADDQFYAFSRGTIFIAAFTNVGQGGGVVSRQVTYQPFAAGTHLCNLYDPSDCVTVTSNGIGISLQAGELKIYFPS